MTDAPDPAIEKPPFAWQPFTPGGVAAFADASFGRLLTVQFIVSALAAAVIVWTVHAVWFPVVTSAITQLPAEGQVRMGTLDWRGDTPSARLAEGRCLAFSVDLKHLALSRAPAHMQVEFGAADIRVYSLFGFIQIPYARDWSFPFNKPDLGPWWGAWAPALLGLIAIAVIVGLPCFWAFLATFYSVPVWLIAFFSDRRLGLGGSWRIAGASLVPGAVLVTAAIFFYGVGRLGLVELFSAWLVHWLIGWIYAWAGVLRSPRITTQPRVQLNPFT